MRWIRCCVLSFVPLCLCGCIPLFLHAGYSGKDVVVDNRLVGTWAEPGTPGSLLGPDTVSFQIEPPDGYRVTYRQTGGHPDSLVFLGHLFRIGSVTLLDLQPHASNVVSAFYVPVHTYWRIECSGDTLGRGSFKLESAIAAAKRAAGQCPVDTITGPGSSDVVFTCDDAGVRRLLTAAVADSSALAIEGVMVRMGVGKPR